MFCTILHNLQSPTNVGTIVRSHVAFGGNEVVFVGHDRPWRFKKSTQAFSRRLERLCDITYLNSDDDLFDWCHSHHYSPIDHHRSCGKALPTSRASRHIIV